MFDVAVRLRRGRPSLPMSLETLDAAAQRVLENHGWSAFYVPLLWSAAGTEDTDPTVAWLCAAAATLPTVFVFGSCSHQGSAAVTAAWMAWREGLRGLGICDRSSFAQWMEQQGLGAVR
eukprot:292776-Karenia_brevis.AAC.1